MGKIMFDIEAFAEQFKKTIEWMLKEGEGGKRLEERIQEYQTNKKNLKITTIA